jgi:REP-associated tyrosine transposase
MNKTQQPWQHVDYVYRLFLDEKKEAHKIYQAFVEKGTEEGKRADLTGGGHLRSQRGWEAIKGYRKAGIRLKGDERILGDSGFVEKVLKSAQESLEEKYGLKNRGYDFDKAVERVSERMDMDVRRVLALDKTPKIVRAGALLCFWAHRKLGITTIEIAGRFKISQSAISRLSRKGEIIEREKTFKPIE